MAPDSVFISVLVHSCDCCCWPCGPCWPTIELMGSEKPALFDLDAVARHHGGEQGLARRRVATRAEHAFRTESEHHVVGIHLVAVVESNTLAQRELDGALVDALPALGQARHRFELALQVAGDEILEDRRLDSLADIGPLAHRLEVGAGRDLLHGDGNHRPGVGLADGEAREQEPAGREAAGGE